MRMWKLTFRFFRLKIFKTTRGIIEIFSQVSFRLSTLVIGSICLILARQLMGVFGISLGYLYVVLISLSGFWFGVTGGIIAATVYSFIFFIEVNMFKAWPFRDLVTDGMSLRFLVYYLAGIIIGYLSTIDENLKGKLSKLAYFDELTNCVNFRWTMKLLEKEVTRCKRYQKEMSIVMVDIDHFKRINDTFGHFVGNDILKTFADVLKSNVRDADAVGRYGGEEFMIILPEANSDQALIMLNRIKQQLTKTAITSYRLKQQLKLSIKFSAGVASFPHNGQLLEELIHVADSALYRAKRTGRDKVIVENRRYVRAKPLPGLKVELVEPAKKKALRPAEVTNVSARGMLLLFPHDIIPKELLCRLHFPEEELPSQFQCRVVHKGKAEDKLYYIGVYFMGVPGNGEQLLERYMDYSQ